MIQDGVLITILSQKMLRLLRDWIKFSWNYSIKLNRTWFSLMTGPTVGWPRKHFQCRQRKPELTKSYRRKILAPPPQLMWQSTRLFPETSKGFWLKDAVTMQANPFQDIKCWYLGTRRTEKLAMTLKKWRPGGNRDHGERNRSLGWTVAPPSKKGS